MTVCFNLPPNASTKDKKSIIILIELQPSTILALYCSLIITFKEGSSEWLTSSILYPKASIKDSHCLPTKFVKKSGK